MKALEPVAVVEVTSEEKEYPVESALTEGKMRGWRAADSGTQTIRLIFDQPQLLKRLALVFEETETKRTQEFVLRWSSDGGHSFREIVRQQWNFSSPISVREIEEYRVDLSGVTVLELVIVPDISWGSARASAQELAPVLTRTDSLDGHSEEAVVCVAIILIFFLAVVFLFVLFLVGLLPKEHIGPRIDLAGIWGLAFVPVELLLKARLRIGSSPKGTHWNFEFSAAKRADSYCRSRAQPFDDPKTAFDHDTFSGRTSLT